MTYKDRKHLKILFVSGNLSDGGAQRVISVVASRLASEGHHVDLLLFKRCSREYAIDERISIHSLAATPEEYDRIPLIKRIHKIRSFVKEHNPDVAVGFLEGGWGLYVSTIGMKMKTISSARVDPKIIFSKKGIRGFINRLWFRHSNRIVIQTESQRNNMPHELRNKCVVIANPISDMVFKCKKEEYSSAKKFVMVGRLTQQKNYELAIKAMQLVCCRYPDALLDIYGKGSEETVLNDLIKSSGLERNIHLMGWTTNAIKCYLKYDVYLLTSDYEGMPNALMEAMGVGLPCISSNCETGPAELILDGKNGFLFPVADHQALADKMIKLIEMSSKERSAIGLLARESIIQRFNSQSICRQWEETLIELSIENEKKGLRA